MADLLAEVDSQSRKCGTCAGAYVEAWLKNDWVRVSAVPESAGNLALHVNADGRLHAGALTRGRAAGMVAAGEPVFLHHALTCTAPRDWLKGAMPARKFAAR